MKTMKIWVALPIILMAFLLITNFVPTQVLAESSKGVMKGGIHFNPSMDWIDPSFTGTQFSALFLLYFFHDSLIKPMPGNLYAPCLAESWKISPDYKVYDFNLRKGVKFHNGDEMTAEDIVFTFKRYKGGSHQIIHENLSKVEAISPYLVRVTFKEPFVNFLDYFLPGLGTIGWIVPKKYIEKVGNAEYKKSPVGCGPYKLVEFKPGVKIVAAAFEEFWRKTPQVKRLEIFSVTEISTRYAMVKRGELDWALSMVDVFYERVKKDPTLRMETGLSPNIFIIYMASQWDPKSPWSNAHVRKAASLAIDRKKLSDIHFPEGGIADSIALKGDPEAVDFPPDPYDPEKAKKLLAEAGYPSGFNAGPFYPQNGAHGPMGEQIANYWKAVGINVDIILLDRAAWFAKRWGGQMKGATFNDPIGAPTISSRLALLFSPQGSYGNYPEIKTLWDQYNRAVDPKLRKDSITRIQREIHEKTMFIPLLKASTPSAIGPRVKGNPFKIREPFPVWFPSPMEDFELNE